MPKWRIVSTRAFDPRPADSRGGWAFDIERHGEKRTVTVELSGTAAASAGPLRSDEAEHARRTSGRSAVAGYLDAEDPPECLVISTHGVNPG